MVLAPVSPDRATASTTLRIGMFSESFHPVQNGVTTSMLTLVAGLRALRHRVCIFAPAHQQQGRQEANVLRFPSFVSSFNRDYPLAYPFYPRLALSLHFEKLRLDVVHTHTPFVLGLTGAKLALNHGVPLVTTFHTLYSQYTHYLPLLPDSVTQTLLEHYLPWYYNRCAQIICPSEVAAKHLREMGIERPVAVIPTGIPLPSEEALSSEACQKLRASLGFQTETPLLLFAGRLAREKNLEWLLEAFARIREQVPDARLLIAGGGPYLEELQISAENLSLTDFVRFLGPTPRRDMDTLFAACDVFCFPSPTETQGLVIGEARAAGAPCVVVNAGGAPETVQHGEDGFRVAPEDQAGFAARVVQILQDSSLKRFLQTGARRNARRFTPERMVERVLSVYENARAQNQPAVPSDHFSEEMDWQSVGQALLENPEDHYRK